jgi:RHS repeat-associated protein
MPGKFLESDPTSGTYGLKIGDYLGAKVMDFTPILTAMMGLDYNSSSIGIDFGTVAPGVKKIQIIPDGKFRAHRVTQRTLDLYTSSDNTIYAMVPRSNWSFATDSDGVITITLKESVATRYLKIHVKFDERDTSFTAKNKATFLNDLAKMLRVYQEATSRTEEFHYDTAGNRTYQMVTLIHSNSYTSAYYSNSDRLKTDGKFAFVYDDAGNLVKKGNSFKINGDDVTFTATSGDGVEYWQYTYDLLNRLTTVTKNGTSVSEYEYSPDGLREVKRGSSGTIHYVFEGTEPIFEKNITNGKIKSYVYALGKHLARVDGVIGDQTAKVYYYHTDQVGSVKAVTDQSGKVVWNADYFAFGTQFGKNKIDSNFEEDEFAFSGKGYDGDTGLYYYNARWYDSETGRFISEDPVGDPNNPNLYSYCANNPLNRIDPSGLMEYSPGANYNDDGSSTPTNDQQTSKSSTSSSSSSSSNNNQQNKAPTAPDYRNAGQNPSGNGIAITTFYGDGRITQNNYNANGTIQSQYNFNSNGTIHSSTFYNDGTRTKTTYDYNKNGVLVTELEKQKRGFLGVWYGGDATITGYNNMKDFENNNANFSMDKNGKVTGNSKIINGNLLSQACVTYLQNVPIAKRYITWFNIVRTNHNWDFKDVPSLKGDCGLQKIHPNK